MAEESVRVTVTDLQTGETESQVLGPGDYTIVTVEPCHLGYTTVYGSGTRQLTIRDCTSTGHQICFGLGHDPPAPAPDQGSGARASP